MEIIVENSEEFVGEEDRTTLKVGAYIENGEIYIYANNGSMNWNVVRAKLTVGDLLSKISLPVLEAEIAKKNLEYQKYIRLKKIYDKVE